MTHLQRAPHLSDRRRLATLSLLALGVVFGDIGTSPLYAFRESLNPEHGIGVTASSVLGVLSLVVWSLVLVISIKYLALVVRADNDGEGGVLALTALVAPPGSKNGGRALLLVGLFGASLLYGDGVITPAISVLSAVEGLGLVAPALRSWVVPITIAILIALFSFQRRGTAAIGSLFGPVILVWFVTIAVLGAVQVVQTPAVLAAVDPRYAARFLIGHGFTGFLVLGSVFLVVTGGEALYADMGHVGRRSIRFTWFTVVLPALLLNYFGQGALLLRRPEAIDSPFYRMVPDWGLAPMLLLATAATIIASQALISGAFSLTLQAVQLGFSPRLEIDHTSASEFGQVYLPAVNRLLMVACILLVVGFRSSGALAAAYGVAVTLTMLITSVLLLFFVRQRWGWPLPLALSVAGVFMTIDLAFLGANLFKIRDGGWFPLALAVVVFTLMVTWKRGRELVGTRLREGALPLATFLQSIASRPPTRVPGTAVFMFRDPCATPPALLTNLKYNHVLHETVVILVADTVPTPRVPAAKRAEVTPLGQGFFSVVLRYGFMEEVDVPKALQRIVRRDLHIDPRLTSYFLGRETLVAAHRTGMPWWQEQLFIVLYRNARHAASFFRLPPERVVELGVQLEL